MNADATGASPEAPSAPDMWTIQRVLTWSTGFLRDRRSETPRLDAELLLAHALSCTRIQLYTAHDKPLHPDEREPFKAYLKRRIAGEPVAYITGVKDFMGLTFSVSSAVLIPRPDTEVLVERALEEAKKGSADTALRILDIGTGSGCIAVSLAKKLTRATVTAWEIDPAALTVAKANAERNGVADRVEFLQRDALNGATWDACADRFDFVVSNPPYIAHAEKPSLPVSVLGFEPGRALFADQDGLAFYEIYAQRCRALLNPGGILLLEIGHAQAVAVTTLLRSAGWQDVSVIKDYGRLDRVILARS